MRVNEEVIELCAARFQFRSNALIVRRSRRLSPTVIGLSLMMVMGGISFVAVISAPRGTDTQSSPTGLTTASSQPECIENSSSYYPSEMYRTNGSGLIAFGTGVSIVPTNCGFTVDAGSTWTGVQTQTTVEDHLGIITSDGVPGWANYNVSWTGTTSSFTYTGPTGPATLSTTYTLDDTDVSVQAECDNTYVAGGQADLNYTIGIIGNAETQFHSGMMLTTNQTSCNGATGPWDINDVVGPSGSGTNPSKESFDVSWSGAWLVNGQSYQLVAGFGCEASASTDTGDTYTFANDVCTEESTIGWVQVAEPQFTPNPTYEVTINALGFPATNPPIWWVTINPGGTYTSSPGIDWIAIPEPNGTYSYGVSAPAGYVASPLGGSVTVSGSAVNIYINMLPAPVTGLAVGAPDSSSELTFTWTNPSSADTDTILVASYTTSCGTTYSTLFANSLETSYTAKGLTADTGYCFEVEAVDGAGAGAPSSPLVLATAPNAASGLTLVSGTTETSISLTWTNPSPGPLGELVDVVNEAPYSGSCGSFTIGYGSGSSAFTSATVTGLSPGTEYCFLINTMDSVSEWYGQTWTAPITASTLAVGVVSQAYVTTPSNTSTTESSVTSPAFETYAGDLIVVSTADYTSGTAVTVTDSEGNTWTSLGNHESGSTATLWADGFYTTATSTGMDTLTLADTTASEMSGDIVVYGGVGTVVAHGSWSDSGGLTDTALVKTTAGASVVALYSADRLTGAVTASGYTQSAGGYDSKDIYALQFWDNVFASASAGNTSVTFTQADYSQHSVMLLSLAGPVSQAYVTTPSNTSTTESSVTSPAFETYAGDLIVVSTADYTSGTAVTVTDSEGNTWTSLGNHASGKTLWADGFYAIAKSTGKDTLTLADTTSSQMSADIVEYGGVGTVVVAGSWNDSTTTSDKASVTTTAGASVIALYSAVRLTGAITASSYTEAIQGYFSANIYSIQFWDTTFASASAGTTSVTFTQAEATQHSVMLLSIT